MNDLLGRSSSVVWMVLFVVLGYLGYDYYSFQSSATSSFNVKNTALAVMEKDVDKLRRRLKEVDAFRAGLEVKKQELRKLAMELDKTRAVLSEDLDVAGFMRNVISEAEHSGLIVSSLKPGEVSKLEYVMQQTFAINFNGVYAQVLGFVDRLTKLQKIVKVDNFQLKPISKSGQRFVELDGKIQIKAFRYLGTKADDLAKVTNGAAQPEKAGKGGP